MNDFIHSIDPQKKPDVKQRSLRRQRFFVCCMVKSQKVAILTPNRTMVLLCHTNSTEACLPRLGKDVIITEANIRSCNPFPRVIYIGKNKQKVKMYTMLTAKQAQDPNLKCFKMDVQQKCEIVWRHATNYASLE